MNFKEKLKKNESIMKIINKILELFYMSLTIISPKLNTKMRYRQAYKKEINLNNPKSLSEKLLWLKLNNYNSNPLVSLCADKFRVREYIRKCGCSEILNDLCGTYDRVEDIDWELLPNKFVFKWNFGAGMNIVCKNKDELNKEETLIKLKKWENKKYWLLYSEMQYKCENKKLICEKYLENDKEDVIPDYKVYCFNGIPRAILVLHDRGKKVKSEFFDCNWKLLKNTKKYDSPKFITEKPECLNELLEISKKLSKPFPFVRCDFYIVNKKIYFGEMTFTPAGGLYTSETIIDGKKMEDFLDISDLLNNKNKI